MFCQPLVHAQYTTKNIKHRRVRCTFILFYTFIYYVRGLAILS